MAPSSAHTASAEPLLVRVLPRRAAAGAVHCPLGAMEVEPRLRRLPHLQHVPLRLTTEMWVGSKRFVPSSDLTVLERWQWATSCSRCDSSRRRVTVHAEPASTSRLRVERDVRPVTARPGTRRRVACSRLRALDENCLWLQCRYLDSYARRVEPAEGRLSRYHLHPLDHQPNQIPPLLEVGLRAARTRIWVQDDALLGPGVDHGVEAVDLPLQLDPYRPVSPFTQHATDVEVVIEGLQPALRPAEIGERATHHPVIAAAGLCEQRLSRRRRREQPEHELLCEFVDGIGDDSQLMPGPTSSAQVAPPVVARPGEEDAPQSPQWIKPVSRYLLAFRTLVLRSG